MLLHSRSPNPRQRWDLRCFVKPSGKNEFVKWYASLSPVGRARLATNLRYLREQPQERWRRPSAVTLKNHVAVIHFQDENRKQHRITGYFDLVHHAFVMCVPGFEKGSVYEPEDYEPKTNECQAAADADFHQRTVVWPWPIR